MPTLAAVIGQERAKGFLVEAMRNGRLSQALLFLGPKGTGRTTLALALLSALSCSGFKKIGDACGECQTCRQVDSRSYPYLKFLKPENSEIKVDQIRALGAGIGLMLPADAVQMVIVEPAEKLNPSSSNALLKVLEEPPEQTYFVLIAENELRLLPTIRSRCQKVYVEPPRGKFLEQLSRLKGRDEHESEVLGRISRASVHLGLSSSFQLVTEVMPRVFEALGSMLAGDIDAIDAASAVASVAGKFRGDGYRETCELIKAIFRDACIFKMTGSFEDVGSSDRSAFFERMVAIATQAGLDACFVAASNAQRAVEGRGNPQLVFEELMFDISRHLGLESSDAG